MNPTTSGFHGMSSGRVRRGAAADADVAKRPGVPMELEPPRPAGAAHWQEPERQVDPGYVLKRKGLEELTPVFGTTVPPRGLSGLLRKAAYGIPEHRTTHWLVLLFADRIDAVEANPLRFAWPIAAGGLVLLLASRLASRKA